MKKVGIVTDNYKVEKFKKDLTAKGFPNFEMKPYTENTTAIFINVEDNQVTDVMKVCQAVEFHFHHAN